MKIDLYNGDCLAVMKNIPDEAGKVLLCDIPYGEVNQKSAGLRLLDRGKADSETFLLEDFLEQSYNKFTETAYIFCGIGQISTINNFYRNKGLTTRLCQWEKSNPSPMNGDKLWLSGSEFCVFSRKPKATFNRHCEKPIWKFPVGRSKLHPTEKPIKLLEYIIESSSNVGDTFLDLTMGSGTTGIACVNTNRNFIGIELDEGYFNIAKERIEKAKLEKESS